MEVVLLWFDELDDLVFAGFSIWLRLRRLLLAIASGTAIAVHVMSRYGVDADSVLTMLSVSLLSISGWGIVMVLAIGADRSARSTANNA